MHIHWLPPQSYTHHQTHTHTHTPSHRHTITHHHTHTRTRHHTNYSKHFVTTHTIAYTRTHARAHVTRTAFAHSGQTHAQAHPHPYPQADTWTRAHSLSAHPNRTPSTGAAHHRMRRIRPSCSASASPPARRRGPLAPARSLRRAADTRHAEPQRTAPRSGGDGGATGGLWRRGGADAAAGASGGGAAHVRPSAAGGEACGGSEGRRAEQPVRAPRGAGERPRPRGTCRLPLQWPLAARCQMADRRPDAGRGCGAEALVKCEHGAHRQGPASGRWRGDAAHCSPK